MAAATTTATTVCARVSSASSLPPPPRRSPGRRVAPWGNTETIRALPTSDSRFPRRGAARRGGYLGGCEPVELT